MPSSYSMTDIGRQRSMNQDYVFTYDIPIGTLPNLYIVADGMGGHNAGDFASRFTVDTVVRQVSEMQDSDPARVLDKALSAANTGLREAAAENPSLSGMGTTFVAAVVTGAKLLVANVGDSRLYILSENGRIRQVTVDHSLVEEMVRSGKIDRELARTMPDKNIITRAVGAEEFLEVEFFREELRDGDLLILCSDGLTNMLRDEDIARIVNAPGNLEGKADRLVFEANMAGGTDNISIVLVDPFDRFRSLSITV